MKSEMRGRLLEAMHYGKLAIKALIPDRAAGHLVIIEQELKALLLECLQDNFTGKDEAQKEDTKKDNSKVKKVDIE